VNRPSLPDGPVSVHVRYVANQQPGDPCWRAIFCDVTGPSVVAHRIRFVGVDSQTAESGQRGHVESHGVVVWDQREAGLVLLVHPAD
jgi:hypothetical protein